MNAPGRPRFRIVLYQYTETKETSKDSQPSRRSGTYSPHRCRLARMNATARSTESSALVDLGVVSDWGRCGKACGEAVVLTSEEQGISRPRPWEVSEDRKSTRLNSSHVS